MMPFDLKEKVFRSLTGTISPVWFPDLAPVLAQNEWRTLKGEIGVTPENYGTARMIFKDPNAAQTIAFSFSIEDKSGNALSVELLPVTVAEIYRKAGIVFYSLDEISDSNRQDKEAIIESLFDAFGVVRLVPDIYSSVGSLVKSMHLIKPESDEYDTSFSEPEIPFSIFVSIPQKQGLINSLRVAEAIVHEAMHLQLTLIEKNAPPFIAPTGDLVYSPWKGEFRTPQGILHALYVFRAIDYFFAELSDKNLVSPQGVSHAQRRRKEINGQIEMIKEFAESDALTALGKQFVRRLVEKIN